jgi:hypothetical protein
VALIPIYKRHLHDVEAKDDAVNAKSLLWNAYEQLLLPLMADNPMLSVDGFRCVPFL